MTRELARCDGLFGPIRVLERKSDGARLYCINGSVQTLMLPEGVSAFGYVHAAKLLAADAQNVLMIGGGGGSLATMLARRDRRVTVLDIDPVAEKLARQYFSLHESIKWLTADPILFIKNNPDVFDAVIVDACDSNGLVSPFNKSHVIANILTKACPNGSLIVNIVREDGVPPWSGWMAAKLAARGFSVCLYRADDGWEGNDILHVRVEGETDQLAVTDLQQHPPEARTYLMSLRPYLSGHRRYVSKEKSDAES